MTLDHLLIYAGTVFIACIIPGPTMLLALSHGIRFGVRRSLATALGNLVVTLAQAAIAIGGLGAVLMASETAFLAIRWTGAALLFYMGLGLLRSPDQLDNGGREEPGRRPLSRMKMFIEGALVAASNPKVIVFFTAIFPQFIDPSVDLGSQTIVLLSTGTIISSSCFMLYVATGRKIIALFGQKTVGRRLMRGIGASFIGAGIGLALKNR